MTHQLIDQMAHRIASGLQRKSVTTPSRWAEKYRVMGQPFAGPWTFRHHPWLKEMHDSKAELNVGQKSAQMGFTETVLNLTFFHIDVKCIDCLYVLPAKAPDASDFSSGRFDPALELSPHLTQLFSDVRNVGHKRAGTANLYIRGSKSRGGLKSIPVGFICLDELDEMMQENIPLALERTSGQLEWQAWKISTPTLPDFGINEAFKASSKEKYFFRCPCCSKLTDFTFPECLEIIGEDPNDPRVHESFLKCKECQNRLHHESKIEWLNNGGTWVAEHTDRYTRGFHINRFYSMSTRARPGIIAESYLRSLSDPTNATEFHNSTLGLPYEVEGSKLTESDINSKREGYGNGKLRPSRITTMGVDVGKYFHVEITEWRLGSIHGIDLNTDATPRVLYIGKFTNIDDIDKLMKIWGIHACVIDANPERRTALQFANRFFGHVRLCIYGQGISGKDIQKSKEDDNVVLVDRTSWMDLALSRFRRDEMITIPADTPFEYKTHLQVPIRVYKKDKNGNPVGYYESRNLEDHYAHARTYSEIALVFAASMQRNVDIRAPV